MGLVETEKPESSIPRAEKDTTQHILLSIFNAVIGIISFGISAILVLTITAWAYTSTSALLGSFLGATVAVFAFLYALNIGANLVFPMATICVLWLFNLSIWVLQIGIFLAPFILAWWLLSSR